MCGIVGIVSDKRDDFAPLATMLRSIAHRGPDDEGYLLADTRLPRAAAFGGEATPSPLGLPSLPRIPFDGADLAFGHRRLAILDLSPAGHQPMASQDGRHWIVFNGEIYNFIELRDELKRMGHGFRTGTDTEVLLAAYVQWGEEALHRLNGMWAFALYDVDRRRLFCARDRFGVKPFFYHRSPDLFVFGSEIKALLGHPRVRARPDDATLVGFLTRGWLDEGARTFFDGIHALPPSHSLSLDLSSGRSTIRRWYRLPSEAARPGDARVFRELLEDAVRLRLRSDVDVGTCLSGGLDSSSIVVLASRLRDASSPTRQRVFSVVYSDPGLAEGDHIEAIVTRTPVAAERCTPTASELAADLPELVRAQDEPMPSSGPYSHFRVMRLAQSAGIKVLLDGQGADETLAGYHYHFGPYLAELLCKGRLGRMARETWMAKRVTGRSLAWLLALAAYHVLPVPAAIRRRVLASKATHSYLPESLIDRAARRRAGDPPGERHQPRPDLQLERLSNLFVTSLPALLRYEDRNSMAFGIEARTPFLDYRLVETAFALRSSDLMRDGWSKRILRDAMAGLLPETIRWRRDKLGFPTPERRFLSETARHAREWLGSSARIATYLRRDRLRRYLERSDTDLSRQPGLWRLLSAELWLRYIASLSRS